MGFRILPGSGIASQYVDPAKNYVDGANLEILKDVGALSPDAYVTASRIDQMRSHNGDGALTVDELVDAEKYPGALTPAERQELPVIWHALELGNLADVPLAPSIPTLSSQVQKVEVPPEQHVLVADLDPSLRDNAGRVSLAFEPSGTGEDVSFGDVARALGDSTFQGMLTAEDAADLQRLDDALQKLRVADPSPSGSARVVIPPLGTQQSLLGEVGPVQLVVTANTQLAQVDPNVPTPVLSRTVDRSLVVPDGYQAVVLDKVTGESSLLGPGNHTIDDGQLNPTGLDLDVEVWKDGQQVDGGSIQGGPLPVENVSFDNWGGIENLETTDGKPVQRYADGSWGTEPPSGVQEESLLGKYSRFVSPLPPGVYVAHNGDQEAFRLNVYSANQVSLVVDGQEYFPFISDAQGSNIYPVPEPISGLLGHLTKTTLPDGSTGLRLGYFTVGLGDRVS
jgi:hypothetical protein